mgnify:CR=1 FL=1
MPELRQIADGMKRRFFGRVAATSAQPITLPLIKRVRRYCKTYPTTAQRVVARLYGIDQGRVNEILHGFRDGSSWEDKLKARGQRVK